MSHPQTLNIQRITSIRDPLFAHCAYIRILVFTVEQGFDVAAEMDKYDTTSVHLLATLDGKPVGTARVHLSSVEMPTTPGSDSAVEAPIVKIGRLACTTDSRGFGVGKALLSDCITVGQELAEPVVGSRVPIMLTAQKDKTGFYEKAGFQLVQHLEEFDEDGCPHVWMQYVQT